MSRHLVDETNQFFPVIGAHDHDRKVLDFPGLNQGDRFEQLIQRACAAGHDDESVGILNEERFADEEVMHSHAAIEVSVRRLLGGQLYVAADRAATDFFGAAVCCFHDAGSAAGHYREPEPCDGRAHFSSEFVMRIVSFDSGRSKNGYAWSDKMEDTKSAQKIAHHSQEGEK